MYYTHRASTKAKKSPTDTSTTNEHSRDPSISSRCIGNPGTPDTHNKDSSGVYIGKHTRKQDRLGEHRVQYVRRRKEKN